MRDSRRMVAAAIAAMATVIVLAPATPAGQAGSGAEHAVLQAERARFAAMAAADAAALDKLLAAELTYTHSNASVQDKAAFIGDIKSGAIRYLTIEPTDMRARVFGNMAIVTGGATVHVIQNGNDLTIRIRYTSAHLNRAGSWQMVAWQSTRVPQ